tara:strand:- start:172 stop:879 length:708 start_codon:yes stop_codon:yes gene_type:complete
MEIPNIICMIPARIGSQRFKQKNLALIDKKSVLDWGIQAAKNSKAFKRIVVNGDHELFKQIAFKNGVDFFLRDAKLGSSDTKSDEVILNFINKFKCDYIVWFNAIAPLQQIEDIQNFAKELLTNKFQSLFAVRNQHIQTLYENQPLNFSYEKLFERTQDLKPATIFVPSMMGWNTNSFRDNYSKNGYGFFCGRTGYIEVSLLSSLVIKKEEDFRMIRSIVEGLKTYDDQIEYYTT